MKALRTKTPRKRSRILHVRLELQTGSLRLVAPRAGFPIASVPLVEFGYVASAKDVKAAYKKMTEFAEKEGFTKIVWEPPFGI